MSVNIESLETQVESAPHTGTSMFRFHARLTLPPNLKIATCRQKLVNLAKRFNFDLDLAEDEGTAVSGN
jgi:glycine cleavage system regulatory protein